MNLLGMPLLVLLIVFALGLPLLAMLCWRRVRGPARLRWAQRIGLLVCCQFVAVSAFGVALNDEFDFFSSWTALLAGGSHTSPIITTVLPGSQGAVGDPSSAGRITIDPGGH